MEAAEWLQRHCDPPDAVRNNWSVSHEVRQQKLASQYTVSEYLTDFSCLKIALGADLLQGDFDSLHPGGGNELFERWEIFRPHLLRLLNHCSTLSPTDRDLLDGAPRLLIHNRDAHTGEAGD